MPEYDDIAGKNLEFWTRMVAKDCLYTRPWLNLDRQQVQQFGEGRIPFLPEPFAYVYPQLIFRELAGKEVLCLAASGGQQSAVFGLLGARVTVFDLTPGQLQNDQKAAEHYGYRIRTVAGDMRDLSDFAPASFDLVYQAISLIFVPDVEMVYREVFRVLRPGGLYCSEHSNPATCIVYETSWDGQGYRILMPYKTGRIDDPDDCEFRHSFEEIFNGLIGAGFTIKGVYDSPSHIIPHEQAAPGTLDHMLNWVQQYFAVLCEKPR